jgi:hypothetical protein
MSGRPAVFKKKRYVAVFFFEIVGLRTRREKCKWVGPFWEQGPEAFVTV